MVVLAVLHDPVYEFNQKLTKKYATATRHLDEARPRFMHET
jgi:hypothetical protein